MKKKKNTKKKEKKRKRTEKTVDCVGWVPKKKGRKKKEKKERVGGSPRGYINKFFDKKKEKRDL